MLLFFPLLLSLGPAAPLTFFCFFEMLALFLKRKPSSPYDSKIRYQATRNNPDNTGKDPKFSCEEADALTL
jgi:hypothetical protein